MEERIKALELEVETLNKLVNSLIELSKLQQASLTSLREIVTLLRQVIAK